MIRTRRRGLRRAGQPEHNVVQNPELLQQLQKTLGLRQAHTAPTMNEGIQPVVIVSDVSKALQTPVSNGKAYFEMSGGAQFFTARIQNPIGSGRRLRIQRLRLGQLTGATTIRISLALGSIAGINTDWGPPISFFIGYDESTIGQPTSTLLPRRLATVSATAPSLGFAINAGLSVEVNVATLDRFPLAAAPVLVEYAIGGGIVIDPGFAFGWQNLAAPSVGALTGSLEWSDEAAGI